MTQYRVKIVLKCEIDTNDILVAREVIKEWQWKFNPTKIESLDVFKVTYDQ